MAVSTPNASPAKKTTTVKKKTTKPVAKKKTSTMPMINSAKPTPMTKTSVSMDNCSTSDCNTNACCTTDCGTMGNFFCSMKCNRGHIVIIVLLLLNLFVGIRGLQVNNTEAVITKIEAMKVGGMENYTKLEKIMQSETYKASYAQNIDMMIMQMENPQEPMPMDDTNTNELSSEVQPEEVNAQPINPESRSDG